VLVIGLFLLVTTAPAEASSKPSFVLQRDWAVAVCETQGDFGHHVGRYEGAWGWYHGTWLTDRVRGAPRHAYSASARQQYRTYLRSLERGRYFGCRVTLGQV